MNNRITQGYQLLRGVVFFAILVFLWTGSTYVLRGNSDIKQRFANFYYEPDQTIDMIYIGSSPVHPYWAAPLAWKEYGFTSASLATNVQQPRAVVFLLKEALKTQKPEVVIFELRMFTRPQRVFDQNEKRESGIRNVTDNMKISYNRFQCINRLVPEWKERIPYYFDIAKYHGAWKHLRKEDFSFYDYEKMDYRKGHLIKDQVVDLSQVWQDYGQLTETEPMPPEQEGYLRELLNYCKEQEITALFTVNPYTDITETVQKQFNYMANIIKNEYGYNFINFNNLYEQMNVEFDKDFYNGGHMNTHGAEKFTRYLSAYLIEHYDLPDKRGNSQYQDWDFAYDFWRKEADAAIATIQEKVANSAYDE